MIIVVILVSLLISMFSCSNNNVIDASDSVSENAISAAIGSGAGILLGIVASQNKYIEKEIEE